MRRNTLLLILLITLLPFFFSCKTNTDSSSQIGNNIDDQLSLASIERISSKILGEEREVWVHVPSEFYGMDTTDVKFPVIYIVDADGHFLPLVGIMDQLSSRFSANDQCPPHIVVGIRNPNRNYDLTPPQADLTQDSINGTGGANLFAKFIKDELMPYINIKYPVAPYTTLAGHSYGGLFTMNTLIEHQDLFDNYIAIDPSMGYDRPHFLDKASEAIRNQNFEGKQLYIVGAGPGFKDVTIDEVRSDTSELVMQTGSLLKFYDLLDKVTPSGLDVKHDLEWKENHFTVPLIGFPNGLKHIYEGYHFEKMVAYYDEDSPQRKEDIIVAVDSHYKRISDKLGYQVKPLESYINAWAMGFGYNGEPEYGAKLYRYNINNYPASPFVHMANGHFKLSQRDTMAAIKSFENSITITANDELSELVTELKK